MTEDSNIIREVHKQINCFLEECPQFAGIVLNDGFSADQRVHSLLSALRSELKQKAKCGGKAKTQR